MVKSLLEVDPASGANPASLMKVVRVWATAALSVSEARGESGSCSYLLVAIGLKEARHKDGSGRPHDGSKVRAQVKGPIERGWGWARGRVGYQLKCGADVVADGA